MSEAVVKILREKPVLLDPIFHIVPDIDPVCPEHYLVLPYEPIRSLAALPLKHKEHLAHLLRENFFEDDFALLERGNANFCTSMNGPHHAHGHLVNLRYFSREFLGDISRLAKYVQVTSLEGCLSLPRCDEEYLLVGEVSQCSWSVVQPFTSTTKRYIRTLLAEMKL